MKKSALRISKNSQPLRLGFVASTDAAPLIVAQEKGYFEQLGLQVQLQREPGWASIRDKIVYGALEAAQAVVGLPFAAALGVGSVKCECFTALVLNLNGNAITISNEMHRRGLADPNALREEIARSRNRRTYTFGIASAFSAHHFLMRQWLQSARINPEQDVRLVVVPPPQMVLHLKSGNLDGFCVGEPWNTVASTARIGRWVTDSTRLAPGHPDKVLLVRRDFAEERSPEHEALIAALISACAYCEQTEHHEEICQWLAGPEYLDTPVSALRQGLSGRFNFPGGPNMVVPDFNIFHQQEANEPTQARAAWALNHLRGSGAVPDTKLNVPQLVRETFRADIYHQAARLVRPQRPASPEAICA